MQTRKTIILEKFKLEKYLKIFKLGLLLFDLINKNFISSLTKVIIVSLNQAFFYSSPKGRLAGTLCSIFVEKGFNFFVISAYSS